MCHLMGCDVMLSYEVMRCVMWFDGLFLQVAREELGEECDYEKEAANQVRFLLLLLLLLQR